MEVDWETVRRGQVAWKPYAAAPVLGTGFGRCEVFIVAGLEPTTSLICFHFVSSEMKGSVINLEK